VQTSAKGAAFIAAHEGVVTKAYRDTAGVWTIGVGHTAGAGPPKPVKGMAISRDEAMAIFGRDLGKFERRVGAALPGVPQNAFDGAVSFDFNTGAIDKASWVRALAKGDTDAARRGLMQWTKAGGRTVAGLVRRRKAEARLIFTGEYGPEASGLAPSVAAKRAPHEVRELQTALASLGFYRGVVDGISGPRTKAAIRAYQQTHPDLVSDGIAGSATRAALARDMAARVGAGKAAVGGLAGLLAALFAAVAGGAWGWAIGLVLAAIGVAWAARFGWRYRDELTRALRGSAREASPGAEAGDSIERKGDAAVGRPHGRAESDAKPS